MATGNRSSFGICYMGTQGLTRKYGFRNRRWSRGSGFPSKKIISSSGKCNVKAEREIGCISSDDTFVADRLTERDQGVARASC